MSSGGLKYRWDDTWSGFQAGWRWWTAELAAMMPEHWRKALASNDPVIAIDVGDGDVVVRRFAADGAREIAHIPRAQFDAATLRRAVEPFLAQNWMLRDFFVLRIPDALALGRTLSLPGKGRNLDHILRHELDRQSPIDRDHVYYDFRVLQRQTNQVDVFMRITRRDAVDSALAVCRAAGVELAAIAFAGDTQPADGGIFPVDPRASLLMRIRRRLVPGLAALVTVLAIGALVGGYLRNQAAADDLADRVDQARGRAQVIERLHHGIEGALNRSAFLARQKQNLMLVRVLSEVTRVLPNGSWIFDFEYRGGEVRISGFSDSASSLIALFDASPLFTDAQFRAPLMQGSTAGQERFDMSFKIRKGAS
ncbi:MAG TPA: PilN domain-containing protein [Rhizomicrobium sp.]|nr:PilN domain-containing protein [Rhizomicrobium sp.]